MLRFDMYLLCICLWTKVLYFSISLPAGDCAAVEGRPAVPGLSCGRPGERGSERGEQPQRQPCCQPWAQPCFQPQPLGLPPSPPKTPFQKLREPPPLLLPPASPSPWKSSSFNTAGSVREAEAQEQAEEALQHDVATKVGCSLQPDQKLEQLEREEEAEL